MKYVLILPFLAPLAILSQTLFLDGGATIHIERGASSSMVLYVDGDLSNDGLIEDNGSLSVNGDANLSGTLDFMIGGTENGMDYSPMLAGGTISVGDGTLNVSLTNGFTPTIGDQFTVLDAGTIDGIFSNLNLPVLNSPYYWSINYQPTLGLLQLEVSTPLPVKLLDFQALAEGEHNRLIWITASEINADRFEVEHSRNGVSFSKIGIVKAIGGVAGQQAYRFLHRAPGIGLHYYRLKQLDADGLWEYSKIVIIDRGKEGWPRILAYPNPTTDLVYLELPDVMENYSIEVFDATGKQVFISIGHGTLQLGHLPAGDYHLHFTHAILGWSWVEKVSLVR